MCFLLKGSVVSCGMWWNFCMWMIKYWESMARLTTFEFSQSCKPANNSLSSDKCPVNFGFWLVKAQFRLTKWPVEYTLVNDVKFETENHKFCWQPIKVSCKKMCLTRPDSCPVNIKPGLPNSLIREKSICRLEAVHLKESWGFQPWNLGPQP